MKLSSSLSSSSLSPRSEQLEQLEQLELVLNARVVVRGGIDKPAGRCGGGVPAVRDAGGAAEALALLHPADGHQVLHPTLH